jgi:hypothetical protein
MSDNIVVSFIALGGILISALISYVVSRRQIDLEVQNQLHNYSSILFQKRLEAYPRLHSILSAFAKAAKNKRLSKELMSQISKDLDNWDSNNTLLLGQSIVVQLARFEKALNGWSELPNKELESDDFIKEIFKQIIAIEHALKLELGVFSLTEFQNVSLKSEQYENEHFKK